MREHSSLPSYYFGLTPEVLPSPVTGRLHQNTRRKITKIPDLHEPRESATEYSLSLNVAGVDVQDIAVVIEGSRLVVELEKEFRPFELAHTDWDNCYGVFTRVFELPQDTNYAKVSYQVREGHLDIVIPKELASQSQPTQQREFDFT